MHLSNEQEMDIKTLRTFLTVARIKNFSLAAKELNSVQPTVSRHISDLEGEIGVKLFNRTTHLVELTAAGKVLLPEAIKIIENDKKVKQLVIEADRPAEQSIRIGYLATACSFFLPNLIGEYLADHENINTQLYEMSVEEQRIALIENNIDIGFTRRLSDIDGHEFVVKELYQDEPVVILPLNHPLSKCFEISISQLKHEKFILFKKASWLEMYNHIQVLCQGYEFSPNVAFHPENMRHLVTSVSSGLGISIVPRCIKFISESNCACIPIKESQLSWPIYMYYRRKQINNNIESLVDCCLKQSNTIQQMIFD